MSYGNLKVSTINSAGFVANLVINPEFTINQRGSASRTTTTSAYNYDRWYYDGTYLYQGIENSSLRDGTYTLSWSGDSTGAYSLNTAGSASDAQASETYTAVTNGGQITISSLASETLWIRFESDLANLTQVKLEMGDGATGFVHRSYGEELALCQRYYYNTYPTPQSSGSAESGVLAGSFNNNDRYGIHMTHPVEMRAVPAVIFYGGRSGVADTADRVSNYSANTLYSFVTEPLASKKMLRGYFDTDNANSANTFHATFDAEL